MFVGLDVGSTTSKALLLDEDNNIAGFKVTRNSWDLEESGKKTLEATLAGSGANLDQVSYLMLTGYGRRTVNFDDVFFEYDTMPEIIAHGKGSYHLLPSCRTIIDIGGQDSKVISLDESGLVKKFQMNDKCAAGTGRYLDKLAEDIFQIDVSELGELSSRSNSPVEISAQCTVFAESEIITYLSQKVPKEDIIAGMHNALALRVIQMGGSANIKYRDDIIFSGGVAKNIGVIRATERILGKKIIVPDAMGESTPQLTAALGTALTAKDRFEKRK